MNGKFKEIFDQIHAEEDLKKNTMEYLFRKAKKKTPFPVRKSRRFIPALVCLLLLLLGGWSGWQIYFTPVSSISIDVNPSMELGINRFDKVISIEGFNQDGNQLAASLDIKFMKYTEALEQILSSKKIRDCLSQDETVSILVVGSDKKHNDKMLSNVKSCTAGHQNTYCASASVSEVSHAHKSGLSYGKYKAYLELSKLNPDITPEDIQGMTMKEIRNLINSLSSGSSNASTERNARGGNGHGHGLQHHGQ